MEEREIDIQYILSNLNSFGIKTPNLQDYPDTKSLIESFSDIISFIRIEQKSKQDLNESLSKCQIVLKELNQQLESKEAKVFELESELSRLQNLISTNNLKFKQEKDKLVQDRDLAKKEFTKMASLCTQYLHDSKKHESAYNKLQEQLRKIYGEKELNIRNNIEMTSVIHKQGVNIESFRGDEDFIYFVKQGCEKSFNYSSEVINVLIDTLNDCFDAIKDSMNRVGAKPVWNPLPLEDPEKLRTEAEFRIKQFEKAMQNVETIKEDQEFPQNSLPFLKDLLKTYKNVIDSNILLLLNNN